MGICLKDLELLIKLREAGYLPDGASVIEIGAQQISNSVLRSMPAVERLGRLFGARSAPPLPLSLCLLPPSCICDLVCHTSLIQ